MDAVLLDDLLSDGLEGIQPYVQGDCFRTPDSQGNKAWHWGNDWCWGDFYISKDVMDVETYRTK